MLSSKQFNWNEWYRRFKLNPEALAEVRNWYPEILAARQEWQTAASETASPGPLSHEFIRDLLDSEKNKPSLPDSVLYFLAEGELGAVAVLIKQLEADEQVETASWQRQIDHQRAELELEFSRLKSQLNKYQDILFRLGVAAQAEPNIEQSLGRAETLFQLQRFGPAVRLLKEHLTHLEVLVKTHQHRIEQEIVKLRQEINPETQKEVASALVRLTDQAETYLQHDKIPLAERAIQQAQILLENGDLSLLQQEVTLGLENIVLREEFPDVRASEITNWLKGKEISENKKIKIFFEKWCPPEWLQQGKTPPKENTTYRTYKALDNLERLNHAPAPFSSSDDRWSIFLQDLFDLLGKRGLEPVEAKAISIQSTEKGKKAYGFWLTECSKDLAIAYTFLDQERLRDGLAIILWHKPNDPLCPKPANLQNELEKQGIANRRLIFLAGEPIDLEDRKALYRAIPTATLLDEKDLLQIIFCSDRPEVRAMHFARAVSRQLPSDQASPFSFQGEVASSMFVGRKDVLRKLLAPDGPTILYGGRKLGKSSIFRQLERIFEKQVGRHGKNIPLYINAVNVVDGPGIKRFLLPDIVQALNYILINKGFKGEANALEVHINSDQGLDGDEFANYIRKLLRVLPDHRFLLLIDEADSLVQYLNVNNDPLLAASERFGWTLRALIQASNGRFDVRFAGFQEISQAPKLSSGPFYNFRLGQQQAYPLSFLETDEALELIIHPLQLLGVMFADESLIELILEYTGQHPALIQKFCMLLYERVRGSRRGYTNLVIREEDVDAIWKNPDFRKEVVRAVLLNVETRDTKPEKILRLLLHLWVQKIMAPDDYTLPVVADSGHLYQLMSQIFGEEAIRQQQLTKAKLNDYLSDLKTLGVLREYGRGYAFHYRYFARLLYYDHFQGQLDHTELKEMWETVVQHVDETSRMQIRVDDKSAMSPFSKKDQEQLEKERQYVAFVLGAAGTGKTEFFNWLKTTQDSSSTHIINAANLSFEELRKQLAHIFKLDPEPDTWQMFSDQMAAGWTGDTPSTLVIIDDVDALAKSEDWPLLWWPADRVRGDDGFIFMLARLTRGLQGKLRFTFTGTFPLTRFWVEAEGFLSPLAAHIVTRHLQKYELGKWCEIARLIVLDEVKEHIWRVSGGDWRLLNTLRQWLTQRKIVEPTEADIAEFQNNLKFSFNIETFPSLYRLLNLYDPVAQETLKSIAGVAKDWKDEPLEETMCCELLAEHFRGSPTEQARWSSHRWLSELRAAVLLQELNKQPIDGGEDLIIVPKNNTWFQLLVGEYA